MSVRRVFLLQTEIGQPDPWDDSLNMANVFINPGLGNSNNAYGTKKEDFISFFQRVDNRFSISNSLYVDSHLVLKRPFSVHDSKTEVPLNFDKIAELVDQTVDGIVLCAAPMLEESVSQQEVIKNTAYYRRVEGRVTNIETGEVLERPRMIPWFFCYKTKELPLYYMVLNPHAVQCIDPIEGTYNGNKVCTISNHLKNINNIIFKPKVGKTARQIGQHNLVVRGDSFTLEPFGTWFVKNNLQGFFDEAKVKVDTNFEYKIENGVITFSTLNKDKGYVSLRWNTGTNMDMTFHVSGNRFVQEYIVDVIR